MLYYLLKENILKGVSRLSTRLNHMTISKEMKNNLCTNLGENLSTIRAKTNISQNELASKLGITRQTITAIETKKRVMQWNTFISLVLLFSRNDEARAIMEFMGIYTSEVQKALEI